MSPNFAEGNVFLFYFKRHSINSAIYVVKQFIVRPYALMLNTTFMMACECHYDLRETRDTVIEQVLVPDQEIGSSFFC